MNRFGLKTILVFSLFLVTACSGIKYTKGDMIKDSNAEIIHVAAKDAAAQIVAIPRAVMAADKNYVVMSAENFNIKDQALNALIQDAIIGSLAQSGFSVLERDEDVLLRIAYQENNSKLKSFIVPPVSENENIIKTEIPKYDIDYGKKGQVMPAKVHENLGTDEIHTADYIISYRILESGVKYFKIMERSETGESQVKRSALVKLNIRITDSKTSKIVYSETLSGTEEDVVPMWQVKYLEESGYDFYPYTLPLQHEKEAVKQQTEMSDFDSSDNE